jgi:cell division protein FtsI (penicillin-binding protein 3)
MTLFSGKDTGPGFHPSEDFQTSRPVVRLDGVKARALETGRSRLLVASLVFLTAYAAIGIRMIDVAILNQSADGKAAGADGKAAGADGKATGLGGSARTDAQTRADIVDRNGVVLATSLPTVSLFAKTAELLDTQDAAEKLASVLPDMDVEETQSRLTTPRAFAYLRRNLTPRQEYDVNALGIPGLYFEKGERRVYPHGSLASHVVGMTDIDNKGVSGIEKKFNQRLAADNESLHLSLDIRMQTIVRNEVARAITDNNAIGGVGMIMDVKTAEVLSMVSLPDFDPNDPPPATDSSMFNRATKGVYEMGSTFKLFNTAAALDYGTSTPQSSYDATAPLHIFGASIHDSHPENRWLSVAEILIHSSNIGAARMAMDLGTNNQQAFLSSLGMLSPLAIELPEVGTPQGPAPWREINTITIAFGHGLSVTPLHLVTGVSALVNGGTFRQPTLLQSSTVAAAHTIEKAKTSLAMRELMREVVESGTGKNADVPGYEVGGKTGTAEKVVHGGYAKSSVLSSFIADFPSSDPRYCVLVMIDEPQGTTENHGLRTGGWTAAPAVKRIIAAIAPLTGMEPHMESQAPPGRRNVASTQ